MKLIGETCLEDLVIQALKCRNSHSSSEEQQQLESQLQPTTSSSSSSKLNLNFRKSFSTKFSLKKPSVSNLFPSSSSSSSSTLKYQSQPIVDQDPLVPVKLVSLLDHQNTNSHNNNDSFPTSIFENIPNQEIGILKGHQNEVIHYKSNFLYFFHITILIILFLFDLLFSNYFCDRFG